MRANCGARSVGPRDVKQCGPPTPSFGSSHRVPPTTSLHQLDVPRSGGVSRRRGEIRVENRCHAGFRRSLQAGARRGRRRPDRENQNVSGGHLSDRTDLRRRAEAGPNMFPPALFSAERFIRVAPTDDASRSDASTKQSALNIGLQIENSRKSLARWTLATCGRCEAWPSNSTPTQHPAACRKSPTAQGPRTSAA